MNLLFKSDLKSDDDFAVLMLINNVPECDFNDYIIAVAEKRDWIENICSCYFDTHYRSSYSFETDDGNIYSFPYTDVVEYVKLAIIRYLQGCTINEFRSETEQIIKNTIFSSVIDMIDKTPPSGIPLVFF